MNAYERHSVTRPVVCPACSDTYLITYGADSVECPLHDGPLAEIPKAAAKRIQANVERELGIKSHLTITARGWLVAVIASLGLWALILTGAVALARAILRWTA